MRRFHFKLQSVAVLRSLRELRARENLARSIRTVEQALVALAEARARRDLLEDMLRSERAFALRAAEHAAFLAALHDAGTAVAAAHKAMADAVALRDRHLDEYYAAARAVKVMDNLESRARAAHRHAGEREEQILLDERSAGGARRAALLT